MIKLTDESKKKIEDFVRQKYLKEDIYESLWKARNKKEITIALKSQLSINEITFPKIWMFVIQTIWKSLEDIFDSREIILFKEILLNEGVISRTKILEDSLNQYMTTQAIKSLCERKMIDVLSFTTNEKLIIIHPKFVRDIFKDGKE